MEGCASWTDLLNGCLGRGRKAEDEPVELTPPTNPYARKLMERLEEDAARRGNTVGKSQADHPKPLSSHPSAIATSDRPVRPRRHSNDLGGVANDNDDKASSEEREHDSAWYEMLEGLHSALKHTRYSISGRMGMSVWGCSRGARDALSVICPAESKDAVKIWVLSTGGRFAMSDSEPDILSFRSRQGGSSCHRRDGQPRLWRIRIRWLPERMFEAMPKIGMRLTTAYDRNPYRGELRGVAVNVLTLPALLDNSASAWVSNLAKGMSQERVEVVAQDIHSILDRIMELNFEEEGSGPLNAGGSRHILDKAFWIPFTQRYPHAPAKFAQCGLGLTSYAQLQPVPHGGMVYPETSSIVPPAKDAGRSLMGHKLARKDHGQVEKPGAIVAPSEQPAQESTPGGPLDPKACKKTAACQTERERHESGDAGQVTGRALRRARELEGRKKNRKPERRAQREQKQEQGGSKSKRHHVKKSTSDV